METHIVGIFNHFEGENKLHIILADNEVDAVKKAIINNTSEQDRTKEYLEWVEKLGTTLEEVTENAYQSELVISNVVSIKS